MPTISVVMIALAAVGAQSTLRSSEVIGYNAFDFYEDSIRIRGRPSDWSLSYTALLRQQAYCNAFSGRVAGKDYERHLVFLAITACSGSNVPLSIVEVSTAAQKARVVGETYGSGLADCLMSNDAQFLACRLGVHQSGCRSWSYVTVLDLWHKDQAYVSGNQQAAKLRDSGFFVNERPIRWNAMSIEVSYEPHSCDDRPAPSGFGGVVEASSYSVYERFRCVCTQWFHAQ